MRVSRKKAVFIFSLGLRRGYNAPAHAMQCLVGQRQYGDGISTCHDQWPGDTWWCPRLNLSHGAPKGMKVMGTARGYFCVLNG